MINEPLNIFHIPQIEPQTFIGVVSTGSKMSNQWIPIAIKYNELIHFHQDAKTIINNEEAFVLEEIYLDEQRANFSNSDLFSAMQCLIKLLKSNTDTVTKNLQVLIITEGDLENRKQIEEHISYHLKEFQETTSQFNINLHILAIGDNFPNSTLEILKELFHVKSAKNLISQIQVSFNSPNYGEILRKKFLKITENLNQNNLTMKTALPTFPWNLTKTQNYINSNFFVTPNAIKTIEGYLKNETINAQVIENPSFNDLLSVHQQWLQNLHLQQKSKEKDLCQNIQQAVTNLTLMEVIVKQLSVEQSKTLKLIRAQITKLDINGFRSHFTEQSSVIRKRFGVKEQVDANILKEFGVCEIDFDLYINDFTAILQEGLIDYDKSDQERSILSFANMKEILCDTDFLDILDQVRDAYQASYYFPLVGQGVLIQFPISQNVWDIKINSIPSVHSTFDTSSIYAQGGDVRIDLEEYVTETINAVIPLFSSSEEDLKPFLRSKFFDTLMTFNVLRSADVCYEEALAAILAQYLILVLSKPSTGWQKDQLALIYSTFQIKYSDNENFNQIKKLMLGPSPQLAFIDQNNKKILTNQSKILLVIFILSVEVPLEFSINQEKIFLYMQIAFHLTNKSSKKLSDYFQYDTLNSVKQQQIIKDIQEKIICHPNCLLNELYQSVKKNVKDHDNTSYYEQPVLKSQIHFFIRRFITKPETIASLNFSACVHYCIGSNPISTLLSPILSEEQLQQIVLKDQVESDFLSYERIIRELIKSNITNTQKRKQSDQTSFTPISLKNLTIYANLNQLKIEDFVYNQTTNVVSNACMSEDCCFYLQPQKSKPICQCSYFINQKFLLIVKENAELSALQIYDICFVIKRKIQGRITYKSKNQLDIIKHIKSIYQTIDF